MLRKYLARLLAFVLVLNLVLCAPLSVGAEELKSDETQSFEADTLTKTEYGEVAITVEPTIPENAPSQSVTVEVPWSAEELNEDGNALHYEDTLDTGEPYTNDISFDLKAEVTEVTTEDGQVTDIEYDISLDQRQEIVVEGTGEDASQNSATATNDNSTTDDDDNVSSVIIRDLDKQMHIDADPGYEPQFKVNMSINGMNDEEVTRVEHTYKETESGDVKVEYYYNAKTKTDTEADSGKKFFTVVQETVKDVTTNFVSLVTNFFGKFHITTDAFENQDTKKMSTTLGEAVNGATSGNTVEMLRDYETGETAKISTADKVTVDLKDHTYTSTVNDSVAYITSDGQDLTVQNGSIESKGDGFYTSKNNNKLTLKDIKLKTNVGGGKNNYNMGIWDNGANNTIKVENSTINSTGSYFGIYHNGNNGGANIQVIGSYVYADGETGQGIYISGNSNVAKNTLTIKDSEIYGETGVEVKFTDVTIDNSKLIGFGDPGKYTANGNGSTTVGTALAVTDNSGNGATKGTIVINSGYFKGAKDFDSIYQAVAENTGDNKASIQLNGGRFVYPNGLYKYTDSTHAVISYNDGSEYPYEVVKDGTTPTRPGYTLQGYKDDKGNDITLAEAIATKAIAYAQWKLIPAADTTEEAPAKTPTTEAPKDTPAIIVEADSKGNNVDVSIKDSTAVVTVSTPAGEAAAVSEVTIPSVAELQKQGVDTVEIQVEEHVTLELGIADTGDTLTDSIKVTREEDTLVISSGEKSEIVIHMTELKAAATEPVRIQYNKGVLTISLSANAVYTVDLKDALAADKALTVKLEDGVLKLYDKDGNLIQEIKL